jgi:hypothetical protein
MMQLGSVLEAMAASAQQSRASEGEAAIQQGCMLLHSPIQPCACNSNTTLVSATCSTALVRWLNISKGASAAVLVGAHRCLPCAAVPRRAAQQQKAPFYFLNAGDEFLGTLWDQLYKGQATAQVQRAVGSVRPNVQVLGK